MEKKGAIELSIGTIVIIVLAMSMLILGMVLVKNIFGGAGNAIDLTQGQLESQINKLFVEDKRTVVHLANHIAKIKQDEEWGIAFGIKNLVKGTAEAGKFHYEVVVSDPDVEAKCGIGEKDIEGWMTTGRVDDLTIAPGEAQAGIVRFMIPGDSPLCTIRFHLDVTKDGSHYATDFFDVEVLA